MDLEAQKRNIAAARDRHAEAREQHQAAAAVLRSSQASASVAKSDAAALAARLEAMAPAIVLKQLGKDDDAVRVALKDENAVRVALKEANRSVIRHAQAMPYFLAEVERALGATGRCASVIEDLEILFDKAVEAERERDKVARR